MASTTDTTSSRSTNPTGARPDTDAHRQALARAETARGHGGLRAGQSPFAMLPDLKLIAQHDGGWTSNLVDTLALLITPIPAADWRRGTPVNYRPLKDIAFELGMTPRALRNHLNRLMHLGAIAFRDSSNYRRYRKGSADEPANVCGVDLAPAILLAEEARARATEIRTELRLHSRLRRHASALRRQIRAILFDPAHRDTLGDITSAIKGDLEALDLGRLDRLARTVIEHIVQALSALLAKCRRLLDAATDQVDNAVDKLMPPTASDDDSFRQGGTCNPPLTTYTTNTVPPYSCSPQGLGRNDEPSLAQLVEALPPRLARLLPAEKRINGDVEFQDVFRLCQAVRPRLGISPDAWIEAYRLIGAVRATTALVITAARYADTWPEERRVRNPGGFFRTLSRLASEGQANLLASIHGIVAYHLAPRTGQGGG